MQPECKVWTVCLENRAKMEPTALLVAKVSEGPSVYLEFEGKMALLERKAMLAPTAKTELPE